MFLGLALGCSILFLVLEMIGFSSAVRRVVDFGKFTHRIQKLILCITDVLFSVGIVTAYLLQPKSELTMGILLIVQIAIGFIYVEILGARCRNKFLSNIAQEIQRLNLNIDEDLIVLRRQLMSSSDVYCSISDLQRAIDLMRRNTAH